MTREEAEKREERRERNGRKKKPGKQPQTQPQPDKHRDYPVLRSKECWNVFLFFESLPAPVKEDVGSGCESCWVSEDLDV